MTTQTERADENVVASQVIDLGEDPIVLGLKQLYDSVLDEPVPADFLALLGQIDETLGQKVGTTAIQNSTDANSSTDGHGS